MTDTEKMMSEEKVIKNAIMLAIAAITNLREEFGAGTSKVSGRVQGEMQTALEQLHWADSFMNARSAPPVDVDKKKIWIGQHVQNGWIAFDGQLFDPEFYEIKEKIPAPPEATAMMEG